MHNYSVTAEDDVNPESRTFFDAAGSQMEYWSGQAAARPPNSRTVSWTGASGRSSTEAAHLPDSMPQDAFSRQASLPVSGSQWSFDGFAADYPNAGTYSAPTIPTSNSSNNTLCSHFVDSPQPSQFQQPQYLQEPGPPPASVPAVPLYDHHHQQQHQQQQHTYTNQHPNPLYPSHYTIDPLHANMHLRSNSDNASQDMFPNLLSDSQLGCCTAPLMSDPNMYAAAPNYSYPQLDQLSPRPGKVVTGSFSAAQSTTDFGAQDTPSTPVSQVHPCPAEPRLFQPGPEMEPPVPVEWELNEESRATIVQMLCDERDTSIDPDYMGHHGRAVQTEEFLTPAMRFMALEWMSDVVGELKLSDSVFCMSTTLMDRYLSEACAFPRCILQLLAAACVFVAAKLEGVIPHPPASALVDYADNVFNIGELIRFERSLSQTLRFHLYGPSTYNFLRVFESAMPLSEPAAADELHVREHVHHLATYIIELAACQYDTLRRPRSVIAIAALTLAYCDRGLLRSCAKTIDIPYHMLKEYSRQVVARIRVRIGPNIDVHDLSLCIAELQRILRHVASAPEKVYVTRKFSQDKYWRVARISEPLSTHQMLSTLKTLYYGE